jgi:hypothetical protein
MPPVTVSLLDKKSPEVIANDIARVGLDFGGPFEEEEGLPIIPW